MTSRSSFSVRGLLVLATTAVLYSQPTVTEDYARAVQLVGQRHIDEAIPILESVIGRRPAFSAAYIALMDAYLQKHAPERAESYFKGLLADPRRSAFAHFVLGRMAEPDRESEAANHYAACVQQRPDAIRCYVRLPIALMAASRLAATQKDLASRIAGSRDSPYACLAFTELLLAQRRVDAGLVAAQRCLAQAERLDRPDFLVESHDQIAEAYADMASNYDLQLTHHQTALQIAAQLEDPEAVFAHGLYVCRDYGLIDRYADAKQCYQHRLDEARATGNRSWLEHSLLSYSERQKAHGELEEALVGLSELLDLHRADGDSERQEIVLLEIGKLAFVQGDLQRSRRACEDALTLTRKNGHLAQQAYVLRELSKVYSVSGDAILALRCANESIAIFRKFGQRHQAGAGIGNLPEIYAFMGDWSSALRYAQESLQSAKDAQDQLEQQDTLAVIGNVLLGLGRYREAESRFQQSLALGNMTRGTEFRLVGLMGLGSAYLGLRDYGHAETRLHEALQLARELGNRRVEATALARLGLCYRQIGRLELVREYFENSLELARRIPSIEAILAAHRGLADLAVHNGDFHEALEHLESATGSVESLRSHIPTSDLKTDLGRAHAQVYEELLYVLAQLDLREPNNQWAAKAFDCAERGRARAFLDLLAESRAQVTKGLSAAQIQKHNVLQSELSRALAALIEHDSEANQRAAALAERNLADWILGIHITNPEYEALRYPRPINTDQARNLAASLGGTILEYALGDRESYLWVVTPAGVRLFRLPPRSAVESAVASYRKLIARPPRGAEFEAWQAPAATLYNMLVKPAEPYLGPQQPLVIVPDGALHYLPFETLRAVGADGRSRCLIERASVSYMPSVSVLSELAQRKVPSAPHFDLLAYGDPVFSREGSKPVSAIYGTHGIRLPPLPNTRREVDGIGSLFPKERRTTLLGPEATEASVKRANLREYRYLHFATHAIVDDRNPARSGIVLSLVNNDREDGILRMSEVLNLEMNADLVVLSACQTGLGSLVRGEGMLGLTRAFLYAGARRVAVSLWDLNDLTAPDFMISFYRQLRQGEAPGAALRSAKIDMLHSDSPLRAHPYSWAPFVLEAPPDPTTKKN